MCRCLANSDYMMKNSLRKILVVDDDQDNADLTASLLRLAGFEVQAVYGGRQALVAARTFSPHLIVLDIEMPEMDGCEVATALRAEPENANLLLVAHSALSRPEDLNRVLRAGFDRFLPKPVAHGALETLVGRCLLVPTSP